jgi:hypothetical protein
MSDRRRTVIKHPNSTFFIVAFFALCLTAIVRSPLWALVYLVPMGCVIYILRTATIVDDRGISARALFGTQTIAWEHLIGIRLDESGAVYGVDDADSQLRLPCVRATRLTPLITASGGRIPDPAA